MAEGIDFEIDPYCNFDGPVTLTLKVIWGYAFERKLFFIIDTIRSLPSLSIIDLRPFELDEKCFFSNFEVP